MGELITAVNAERIAGFPNGPLFLDSAEQELAGALVDRHAVRRHSASTYRGGLTPARLRRVVDLVHAKIEDEVTLNELAESVGLSTAHFSQTFLKSTGKSPHQFVLHHRVERAKQMLRAATCESWILPWPAASKRSSTLRECSGNCAEPAQRNIGKNFCARSDLALKEDAT